MNSQTPSLASTINLSSLHKSSSKISKKVLNKMFLTRFTNDSHTCCYLITKRSSHRKSRNVFIFQPYSQGANCIIVLITETINSTTTLIYSCSFVCLTWLLISADCLSFEFSINYFAHNSSRITHINAKKLLTQGHDAHTSTSTESYIQLSVIEFIVTI